MATDGVFTEFQIPTANSYPEGIATGPDGALLFTELLGKKSGRITTGGAITEFSLPTESGRPSSITTGLDGALWFTQEGEIGRITTSGVITEFSIPHVLDSGITGGPDGALWFTEHVSNTTGRSTTPQGLTAISPHAPGSEKTHPARRSARGPAAI